MTDAGEVMLKCVALEAGETLIKLELGEIEGLDRTETDSVWLPELLRVTENALRTHLQQHEQWANHLLETKYSL